MKQPIFSVNATSHILGKLNQGLIQSFMHYQAVTQLLHSDEKARSLPGKLGSHLKATFMELCRTGYADVIYKFA